MDISLTTTQAAKVLDIEVKTLRFWDQSNCLPVQARQPGQWRKFSFDDLVRVSIVDRMVRLGLPVCFASDRLQEAIETLTVDHFESRSNASIGIASFRGARTLVAVKYIDGPHPESIFDPRYWASRPAYSVELVEGVQRPFHMGKAGELPDAKPEAVSIISISSTIERLKDRLDYYRVASESGLEDF